MNLSFTRFDNNMFVAFSQNLISLSIQEQITDVTGDHPVFKQMQSSFGILQKSDDKPSYNGQTQNLRTLNKTRIALFHSLKKQVEGQSQGVGLQNQEIAKEVYAIFPKYAKELTKSSLASKSATLNQLIRELSEVRWQTKLTTLHVTETFNLLKTAQQQFDDAYLLQNKENTKLSHQPSTSQYRKIFMKDLQRYLNLIDAMQHQPVWKELYAETLRLYQSIKSGKHQSHADNKKETNAEPEKENINISQPIDKAENTLI